MALVTFVVAFPDVAFVELVALAVAFPAVALAAVAFVAFAGVCVQVPLARVKLVWQRVQVVLVQLVQFMLH